MKNYMVMGTDKVVGMGEVLWDVFPDGKKMGGAPANFAYHMSRFGFESYVVSAVGNDDLGREILNVFEQKGLSADRVETVDYPTGTVYVQLDDAGIPAYDITRNVAWDYIPYTSALHALAGRVQAVCFGSLAQRSVVSRETINRFLDAMPQGDEILCDAPVRTAALGVDAGRRPDHPESYLLDGPYLQRQYPRLV